MTRKPLIKTERTTIYFLVLMLLSISIIFLTAFFALMAEAAAKKPQMIFQSPRNNSYLNSRDITFIIKYAEKNVQSAVLIILVDNSTQSYNLACPSGAPATCSKTINVSTFDGKKIEYYFAVSNPSDSSATKLYTIFIDLTPPEIIIKSPSNIIYNTSRIELSAEMNEKSRWIKKAVDNSIYSMLCSRCNSTRTVQMFREGQHSLAIQAMDSAGNLATKIIQFTVDSRKPIIHATYPVMNRKVNSTVNFTVFYTEQNLKNVSLYLLNSTGVVQAKQLSCEPGRARYCSTFVDLSEYDGQLNYYFNIKDQANEQNSRLTAIKVNALQKNVVNNTFNNTVNNTINNTFNLTSGLSNLSSVRFFAYQLQNINDPGTLDALINSRYDMLVIEPTRTDWSFEESRSFNISDAVSRLKASKGSDGVRNKIVIAYIDIGEAEDWRWYWTWSKEFSGTIPADWPNYILAADPDGWVSNYPVVYWDQRWKNIVIYGINTSADYNSVLDEVIKDGFDGVYLDWVEGYEFEPVVEKAQQDGKDSATEMVNFIREIREYSRARNPNFIVIQQNAAALYKDHPNLFSLLDGIAQEAVWYDGVAGDTWDDIRGYDYAQPTSLTQEYLSDLGEYQKKNVTVFNVEYAVNYASSAYQKSYQQGYVPYATRRSLSKLTTTPPPGLS